MSENGGAPSGEKPGVLPLRAVMLSEIFAGAVATIRAHPGLMLGAAVVVVAITEALGLLVNETMLAGIDPATLNDPAMTPEQAMDLLGKVAPAAGVTMAIALLAQTVLSGFGTVVVGKAVLGHPVPLRAAVAELRPRLFPLLGLTVVFTLIVLAGPVAGAFLFGLLGGAGALLFLGTIVLAVWLYVRFSLATPALVLERSGIGQALARSQLLVRTAWWRTFGILLLAFAISVLISLVVQLPFSAGGGADAAQGLSGGSLVVSTIGSVIAGTVTYPFTAGVTALVYVDRRMRAEGMATELARAAENPPA